MGAGTESEHQSQRISRHAANAMLIDALDRLIVEHDRVGSPMRQCLRPGLDTARIARTLDHLSVNPHRSLIDLFGWADGVDFGAWRSLVRMGQPHIIPGFDFRPLSENVATARLLSDELGAHGLWMPGWCPVFWSQTSGYIVDAADGAVWFVAADDLTRERESQDLEGLVERSIEQWREGEFFFDEDRGIHERL